MHVHRSCLVYFNVKFTHSRTSWCVILKSDGTPLPHAHFRAERGRLWNCLCVSIVGGSLGTCAFRGDKLCSSAPVQTSRPPKYRKHSATWMLFPDIALLFVALVFGCPFSGERHINTSTNMGGTNAAINCSNSERVHTQILNGSRRPANSKHWYERFMANQRPK